MATAIEVSFMTISFTFGLDSVGHREWVARCLGQATEMNKEAVQKELKQVIGEAFANKTLWTTDWNGVQLQR